MINDRLLFLTAVLPFPFFIHRPKERKLGTAFSLVCSIDDLLARLVWDRVCI